MDGVVGILSVSSTTTLVTSRPEVMTEDTDVVGPPGGLGESVPVHLLEKMDAEGGVTPPV